MVKKIEIDNETNELNYLFGGYFSGQGRIYYIKEKVNGRHPFGRHFLRITVCFEDLKDAEMFKHNWGGNNITTINPSPSVWTSGKNKVKKIHRLTINHSDSGFLLNAIQPYIIGKFMKKKVNLAIKIHNYCQKHWHE
ncbi:hypothetical protein LCGC14_2510300, partial [marine sediment metagenome]